VTALDTAAAGLSADDVRRAALTVCRYAVDADEARRLLEALGLLDVLVEERLAG
jgi:hypothetical protein